MGNAATFAATRLQPCFEWIKGYLPKDARERIERKSVVEQGATFTKRNFTFGGFSLSTQSVFVYVKNENQHLALIYRPAADALASGNEIHAGDIKTINANGSKSITIASKKDDVLLEIEGADEAQRDTWLVGLNEVLLKNFKGQDGGVMGAPKNLKERAEKELYFQRRSIEMAQKKKESDERKAKFMKEAGGLKYTALAMGSKSSIGSNAIGRSRI